MTQNGHGPHPPPPPQCPSYHKCSLPTFRRRRNNDRKEDIFCAHYKRCLLGVMNTRQLTGVISLIAGRRRSKRPPRLASPRQGKGAHSPILNLPNSPNLPDSSHSGRQAKPTETPPHSSTSAAKWQSHSEPSNMPDLQGRPPPRPSAAG